MANSVDDLLKRPFFSRSLEEKVRVKELGRPTPNLNLSQKAIGGLKKSEYTRKFNMKLYENKWICGCDVRNALFCFPCLLFGNSDAWSTEGVKDLGHIHASMKKHSGNDKHINNALDLSVLGKTDIATILSRAYHDEIVKHNRQVEKNRYVLSRIIDCIKFCGAFELALRGHDESETSKNSGVFLGLIDLISDIDSAVKEHVEGVQVFKGISKCIQNELLDCMLETCREVILEEIKQTEFAAIMVDETTDVSGNTQLILVLRYVKNSAPYERFWGFFNPKGCDADALTTCILNVIDPLFKDTPHRIIAQTYDGVAAMSGCKGGIQAKIKTIYPNAHYVHCYAHQLNLIMQHAASQNQSARVFFLNLLGFPAFFSRSPERLSTLEAVAARRFPNSPATKRNFKLQAVNVVYENRTLLLECLLVLEKSPSDQTCYEAVGLRHNLLDEEFIFWLAFFHKLMPHVDILHSQLQTRSVDAVKVKSSVSHFLQVINNLRASIDDDTAVTAAPTVQSKRQKINICRRSDAKEVCDRISREACDRFQALAYLDTANLLDSSKFEEYSTIFPERELNVAVHAYIILDKQRLKTELSVLYERPDFRNIAGAVPLLQFILNNNLQDTFSQITKLLKIIVTTPMITAEPERCFSSHKRIKTFLQNTKSEQQQLSALAMLSIEKNVVTNIEGFNSKVINKFCSRNQQHMDFIFRY